MHKSCQKVGILISQAQDRKLSLNERVMLKFHLMICQGCKVFHSKINFLRRAAIMLNQKIEDGEKIGEGLSDDCAERIKAKIQSEEK